VIRAQYLGDAAQFPKRSLHAGDERFEGLAEGQRHPPPTAEAQHQLEQKVSKRATCDRDAEVGRVREVDGRLSPWNVPLLEEHLLQRAVQCAPISNAPLQRA